MEINMYKQNKQQNRNVLAMLNVQTKCWLEPY